MYTNMRWLLGGLPTVTQLKCIANDYQEPYVLLKKSPETPLFDERFVNYGYNKVQLVENLRWKGKGLGLFRMKAINSWY